MLADIFKFTFYYIYIKTHSYFPLFVIFSDLHSTIFILKRKEKINDIYYIQNLHSTIFILKH